MEPALWFMYLEAEFCNKRVTADQAKFSQLLARLPKEVTMQVRDLLLNLPTEHRYEALKEAVIKRITPSDRSKLQQLFRDLQLGDKRPSDLLLQMQQLLSPSSMDEALLKELWMQRLPANTQIILIAAKSPSLLDAAQLEDEVQDRFCIGHSASLTAVTSRTAETPKSLDFSASQGSSCPPTPDDWRTVWTRIAALRRDFARHRTRSPSRRRRSKSPRKCPQTSVELCWYHNKFGNRAKRCVAPCKYFNHGNAQAGP